MKITSATISACGTGRGFEAALIRIPPHTRGHIVAVLGEFIGTTFFLLFAFAGTQVAIISSKLNAGMEIDVSTTQGKDTAQLLYISLSFGFSLMINAWVFFRISGGLFNPAVTLGMVLIRALPPVRGLLVFLSQIAGGIVAAAMCHALFPGELNVGTTLSASISLLRGVFIEVVLTTQLVFTIFMLAAEKHKGTFIAPVGIGMSLFVAELVGVFWTGGSLNPARSFGPAIVTHHFTSDHWVYWVGPLTGASIAVLLYRVMKALEYEYVTPNPADDGEGVITSI